MSAAGLRLTRGQALRPACRADITHLDVRPDRRMQPACSTVIRTIRRRGAWIGNTLWASADLALASERDEVSLLFICVEPLLEFPLIERAVASIQERRPPPQKIKYQVITMKIAANSTSTSTFL